MSYLNLDSSEHDTFVSLAINAFLTKNGGDLVRSDGGLAYREHLRKTPPQFFSYRPDAVVEVNETLWLIEVKSYDDLFSVHSQRQFADIAKLCASYSNINFNLFVFGTNGRNVFVPPIFEALLRQDRLIINFTELSMGATDVAHI